MDPTSKLDDLLRLIVPPSVPLDSRPPDHSDWNDVVVRTGLEFPYEFRQLIYRYGTFCWGDFLHILNPFSSNVNLRMEARACKIIGSEMDLRKDRPKEKQVSFWPTGGGLYPWAVTDNGDCVFWKTLGIESWWPSIVVPSREFNDFEYLPLSTTAILYQFMLGTLQSKALLDPFEGIAPIDAHE